jgi:sphingomyelin phosphodiesterase acid-like 3
VASKLELANADEGTMRLRGVFPPRQAHLAFFEPRLLLRISSKAEFAAKISRCFRCVLALSGVFAMFGCGGSSTPVPASSVYQVVAVSDLHFNPLYDPSLYSSLAAADASQWAAIFQGSTVISPAGSGTDTNYPLLSVTLADMKQRMGASPVVLFTGDLLGHYIPENFYCAYYKVNPCTFLPPNPPNLPTPDPTAVAAMQQFVDKTFAFVAAQLRAAAGNTPVLYVPGNIDTYQVTGMGPDNAFLADNASTVYYQLLNGIVDQGTFLNTFLSDGYYSEQPLGSHLLVIGLNTNSFAVGAPSSTQAPAELAWLSSQLSSAQAAGQTVWILMHVPPGANSQAMAGDKPGQLEESNVSMNWDTDLQAMFLQTLTEHASAISLMLAGHTHMDEFRILPTGNVLEQLPGISPCFGNNPAYKILTITQDTFLPTDYESFDYNLSATPPAQFTSLYTLSSAYGFQGGLNYSLQRLYPQLLSDESQRALYTNFYASGITAINPKSQAPWNPINATNWPIFSCTIRQVDVSDYINCVNSY